MHAQDAQLAYVSSKVSVITEVILQLILVFREKGEVNSRERK